MSGRRAKKTRQTEATAAGTGAARRQRRSERKKRGGRRGSAGGPLRTVAFVTLAAAVLAAAVYFIKPALFGGGPPPTTGIIDVTADMGGFNRRVIRVKAGEPITVRLTSLDNRYHVDGGGKHEFAVDELDLQIIAPSLGSASETFTPTEPGTYEFYCSICCGGRANPTMIGTLIVEP